jgi:uncharacterized membrane protein
VRLTKIEFVKELTARIESLPQSEIDKSIAYYNEIMDDRIEDGMAEDGAVAALGDISVIAENIMYDMPLSTLMKARVFESKNKAASKGLWIALVSIGFPVWFPLLMTFIVVVLAIYITIWALIISLYAVVISLGVSGIAGLIAGIALCFVKSFPVGLCTMGTAIFCGALTLFMIKPVITITKSLVKFTAYIAHKIKSVFITKSKVLL